MHHADAGDGDHPHAHLCVGSDLVEQKLQPPLGVESMAADLTYRSGVGENPQLSKQSEILFGEAKFRRHPGGLGVQREQTGQACAAATRCGGS